MLLIGSASNFRLCSFGFPLVENGQRVIINGIPQCTISTSRQSLVVSILSAGTFFGALLAAPVADKMGRRTGIIFSCLVFSIGIAMQVRTYHLYLPSSLMFNMHLSDCLH